MESNHSQFKEFRVFKTVIFIFIYNFLPIYLLIYNCYKVKNFVLKIRLKRFR